MQLHIHTHVREDALSLFGFVSAADKALFEKLITVSGIGPKLAINGAERADGADLVAAIRSGAVEHWCGFPASARKPRSAWCWSCATSSTCAGVPDRAAAAAAAKSNFSATEEDVISALMNFGANRASAEAAVNKGAVGERSRTISTRCSGGR